MLDPYLRLPVWLTREQRQHLGNATLTAIQHADADIDLCQSLLQEILDANHREEAVTRLVTLMIEGLKLPHDVVPVFVCEAEITQLVMYGDPDQILVGLLQPQRGRRGGRSNG